MKEMNLSGSCDQHSSLPKVLPFRQFSTDECLSLSVDASSKGNQRKWKTLDGKFYIKEQFVYADTRWKDFLVETVATKYASLCQLPEHVQVVSQGPCTIDGRPASYSEAFDTDGSYFVSFLREYPKFEEVGFSKRASYSECFRILVERYVKVVGEYARDYLPIMALLDVVVGNEDRHLNNFGYRMTSDGLKPAPLFDFGLGLFEHDPRYADLHYPKAIKKVRLKPVFWTADLAIGVLKKYYPDCLDILPKRVSLSDFQFPSKKAEMYFRYVNERLGVRVDVS